MSVLAFKAIGYGAEQIPDSFFEKIPGGYFTPAEKKKRKDAKEKKDRDRRKRSSRRDRSPQTDYTDYSAYDDSDYERGKKKQSSSRRTKSEGRNSSRSPIRGRDYRRSRDLDGEYSDYRDMARAEQGDPYFPPPPTSEYTPYNPQDYASQPAQGDYRPSSAGQPHGYPTQVNVSSPFPSVTSPPIAAHSAPVHVSPLTTYPPTLMNRPSSSVPPPLSMQSTPLFNRLSYGTPLSASFSPSYEPPLAALLQRSQTNSPKSNSAHGNAYSPSYSPNRATGQQPRSSTAARYTPGPGYAPSPVLNNGAYPPPPVGSSTSPYPPYNPADYPPASAGYSPSPPPFSRHRSNSQPASPPYPSYNTDQRVAAYDDYRSSSRRDSTKPRREHRHRARSADTQASRKDGHRDGSRMAKVRDRFDSMDLRGEGLAAAVGGALAGGLAGRQLGRGKLTALAGAAAGALGGKAIADRRSK